MLNKKAMKFLISIAVCALGFYVPYVLGGTATGSNIASLADNVKSNISSVVSLLTAGSYMAGFGLVIGSLFKFKAHKDNPQQAPLGTCVTMLVIGISLIFLPSILTTGGSTIFGSGGSAGNTSGFTNIG